MNIIPAERFLRFSNNQQQYRFVSKLLKSCSFLEGIHKIGCFWNAYYSLSTNQNDKRSSLFKFHFYEFHFWTLKFKASFIRRSFLNESVVSKEAYNCPCSDDFEHLSYRCGYCRSNSDFKRSVILFSQESDRVRFSGFGQKTKCDLGLEMATASYHWK